MNHTFDTLTAARTLQAAGMEAAHAEAIVATMSQAVTEGVATKADIADLRAELKGDLVDLKADLLKVAIGIVLANAALTAGLVRLLS